MNKKENELLEKAYAAEVESALNHSRIQRIMQTKSKTLAEKLVSDGMLRKVSERFNGSFPCTVDGYELTELGRMSYCLSCNDLG